ncbi:hypothetical protein, partial [Ralstonia pickettii]|uniref:hypothetical protein n=2 Tax=Burkholderiales TaxID=80840 RepID=UPI002D7860C6
QAFVATILAAVCVTAMAAEEVGRSVAYSVKIMRGSELVSKINVVTRDGKEVPFESTREQAYLASCSAD